MAMYGTAGKLRSLCLNLFNGDNHSVDMGVLLNTDDEHRKIVFELLRSYELNGESDDDFMDLCIEIQAKRAEAEKATANYAVHTRRNTGDIVRLDANSGFCNQSGDYQITDGVEPAVCKHCKNTDCREWPNLERLDHSWQTTGEYAYDVPECSMHDHSD